MGFNMPNTMAIVTNWDKIFYFSILSITIYMMNYNDSHISNSAIITFLLIMFPCILPVIIGFLSFFRHFVDSYQLTRFATAIYVFIFNIRFYNIKRFIANFAISLFSISMALLGTFPRTIFSLRRSFVPFSYKHFVAIFTFIYHRWLFSIKPSAFTAASKVSISMAKRYFKFSKANRTGFFNFFHEKIISQGVLNA